MQGRSARVVEDVLTAVAEELGRVGYAGLRIEDVAARSLVNKTTIYRRWPTKSELVAAALARVSREERDFDTGSLRDDMLALMREFVARVKTPIGRGVVRMVQAERADPEVNELIRRMRQRGTRARHAIFERAVARGELPEGSDCAILSELMMAPLVSRLVHQGVEVDERFLSVVVDTIIAGARTGTAVNTKG